MASVNNRPLFPPCQDAHQIDSRGTEQILEMRFRHAIVPATAETEGTHPLRRGAFNPCSRLVFLPERSCLFDEPSRPVKLDDALVYAERWYEADPWYNAP